MRTMVIVAISLIVGLIVGNLLSHSPLPVLLLAVTGLIVASTSLVLAFRRPRR